VIRQVLLWRGVEGMELRRWYLDLMALAGVFLQKRPLCGPRIVQIDISENCNLDCLICNRSSMGVSGLLDADRILSLAEEVYALGAQEIFFHGFGEPACHPRLPDIIRHVRSQCPNLRQHLITNGTWNSPVLRNALVEGGVSTRFSLHAGDEETWQRLHPRDAIGYFHNAGDNVRYLAERLPDRVEVLYVICSLNIKKIPEMVSYASAHGVRKILFRPMRLFKDRNGQYMNAALQPNAEEYRAAADTIAGLQQKLRGRMSVQSVPFEQHSYNEKLARPSSRKFFLSRSCYIGYVLTVIERDGGVWGCLPESSDNEPLGNIFESSFRKIWYGSRYAGFRKKQLFLNKEDLDPHGCHSYCQHLDTNIRLNRIKPWRSLRKKDDGGVLP
jgi:MoaA/NifB/PqqE/SkfB family radical SAM enzyme